MRSCGWTAGLRVAAAAAGIGAALLIGAGVAAAHTGSADTESAGPTTSTSSAAAGDTARPGAAHSRASATRTSPRPNAAPPSQNLGDDAATDTDAAVAPARRSATTLDKSAETGRRESLQAPNRREESVPQPTPRRHLRAEKTAPTVASPSAHTSPAAMASANSGASPDPAAASPPPAGPSAAADTQVVAQPVEAQPVAFETPALATTSVTRSTALSPVNAIGTLIFNALSAAARLFDPPPTIPPDSSVTRGTSTLTLPCDCAQTLKTDWYFPNQSTEPVGLIYLQHGFLRSKTNVSALAVALAERTNSVVVAPTVTSNSFAAGGYWINGEPMQHAIASLFTGDRAALAASASAAAGETVTLPTPFVIAGHSAGGNLAAAVAGFTTENGAVADLRAVIMFDGVDSGGAIAAAATKLIGINDRPIYQIAAECALCNAFGSGTTALVGARPDRFVGVKLVGGTHVDAEGDSSGLLGWLVCGRPLPRNIAAVQSIGAGWITDAFTGSHTGVYGGPGEQIPRR